MMWTVQETTPDERDPYIVPEGYDFFKVVDTKSGEKDHMTHPTAEKAQKRADALNNTTEDDLFDAFFGPEEYSQIDYFGPNTPKEDVPEQEPEAVFVEATLKEPREVGAIIQDGKYQYRVTKKSYYLSARDVADLEDGYDVHEDVGWHTEAELIENGN